jgi:hypothetical protein
VQRSSGGYNTFRTDPGNHPVEINDACRTSIVTTPDGQISRRQPCAPPARPRTAPGPCDSYEDRPPGERRLALAGRNAGSPMLSNGCDTNACQILQTADKLVILIDTLREVRVVRLNSQHRADGVRPWEIRLAATKPACSSSRQPAFLNATTSWDRARTSR